MRQNNFDETIQSTDTNATFYPQAGFLKTLLLLTNYVNVAAIPEADSTRLIMLADTAKLSDRAIKIAEGEIPLVEVY